MSKPALKGPFPVIPGVGIGPFLLGMTPERIAEVCSQTGLKNEGAFRSGLHVEFSEGCAVRIEVAADLSLSLAEEPLTDPSNGNVQRLLDKILPPAPDWTERDGLVVLHWELSDTFVFSFLVYSQGFRSLPA